MARRFEIADGWHYEALTSIGGAGDYGDANIYAPDGSHCGLAWAYDESSYFTRVIDANESRWGVFGVSFPEPAVTEAEIRSQILLLLPQLKAEWRTAGG